MEKIDHPLTAFIKHLAFLIANKYEIEFEKLQSKIIDEEKTNLDISQSKSQRSYIKDQSNNLSRIYLISNCDISEDEIIFTQTKNFERNLNINNITNFFAQNIGLDNFFKKIQKEILFISQILTGALIRFYEIKNSCSNKILEIFYEKIKDIFIRNDLYRIIYEIKSNILHNKKNKFSNNLIKLYNSKTYYFSTNPYFCMDAEFKKIIKKILKKYNTFNNLENEKDNENEKNKNSRLSSPEKEISKSINFNESRNSIFSRTSKIYSKINPKDFYLKNESGIKQNNHSNEVCKNILTIPFEETLLILRKFNDCNSMLRKLDLMFMLRASIMEEIDFFWEGIPLKGKYKLLDADNILSIFVYLIIKGQMTNLPIDIDIMDSFFSKQIKLSRKGYFFSIFQSSVEYIVENLNMEQIDKNIKEYNDHLIKEMKKLKNKPYEILDYLNNIEIELND